MITLSTTRLTLTPPAAADWPVYAAHNGTDRDEAWAEFTGDIGHWVVKGFGWFLAREGETAVGSVGLHHPPAHAEVELAWNTYERHEGRGFAPEAAAAVLGWSASVTDALRIVSYIDRNNSRSRRVAEKLGATNIGVPPDHDPDCDIWVHERKTA